MSDRTIQGAKLHVYFQDHGRSSYEVWVLDPHQLETPERVGYIERDGYIRGQPWSFRNRDGRLIYSSSALKELQNAIASELDFMRTVRHVRGWPNR